MDYTCHAISFREAVMVRKTRVDSIQGQLNAHAEASAGHQAVWPAHARQLSDPSQQQDALGIFARGWAKRAPSDWAPLDLDLLAEFARLTVEAAALQQLIVKAGGVVRDSKGDLRRHPALGLLGQLNLRRNNLAVNLGLVSAPKERVGLAARGEAVAKAKARAADIDSLLA